MTEQREDQGPAGARLEYRSPEIADLGSVVELTEASTGVSGNADGAEYSGHAS
jgi:hypothetical protein